ncbi:MAG: transcriptional regulator [Flavobacterium sp.]
MNYIKHLTGFFNRIALEDSINPTHISLYIAIFQRWNLSRFQNPVLISREEVMKISKIASLGTYHKCIRDLERLGYLEYSPSYNPYSGTAITMINFANSPKKQSENRASTSSKNEVVKKSTTSKNEQVNEQVHIYNINNKTYTNNKNIDIEKNENLTSSNFDKVKGKKKKEKKGSAQKKEKELMLDLSEPIRDSGKVEIPSLELVKEYFLFQHNTEFEAERFFNYYTSNGWLIGGKTKMEDWKASARNWMLNTPKFSANAPKKPVLSKENDRAYNLNVSTDKNYSEPL